MHQLVGIREIAGLLAVSPQRVHQLSITAGFPAPTAELSSGRIWHREEIECWAREAGRIE